MTAGAPFDVAWSPTSRRDLARLPEKVVTAVVEFVYGALAESPARVGHSLRFELEGTHSANRGDYRIIYAIDHGAPVVIILAVDHRRLIAKR